jgi:hypothetical protein
MNFLTGLAAGVIEWVLGKAFMIIAQDLEAYQAKKQAQAKAQKDLKEVANAQTPDEKLQSSADIARDTFS